MKTAKQVRRFNAGQNRSRKIAGKRFETVSERPVPTGG
jgi:hypothetical protein